ncbi:Mediator of RNA polymerase II transcription subunit 6 [Entophlyctis sp. JEL0112]|nr:Mediator of RNA polymerase II transcription subunit 6 [Entophlyctis sp. JEL0112]
MDKPLSAPADPFSVSFKDTVYLETRGLSHHNALEYFQQCPQFYDKSCINEQIQMQARFNSLNPDDLEKMKQDMIGIEYALHSFSYNPSLFVIHKYNRTKERVDLSAVYYIAEGTIYQSPDLSTLLSNRVLTSLHHITSAFSCVSSEARFQPARPYHWGFEEDLFEQNDDYSSLSSQSTWREPNMMMAIDDAELDYDDGITIEAGGRSETRLLSRGTQNNVALSSGAIDLSTREYMKLDALSATSFDRAIAAHEFSSRVDGLLFRVRSSEASAASAPSGAEAMVTGDQDTTRGRGLLDSVKAAARARIEALAAQQQQQQLQLQQQGLQSVISGKKRAGSGAGFAGVGNAAETPPDGGRSDAGGAAGGGRKRKKTAGGVASPSPLLSLAKSPAASAGPQPKTK